MATKARTIMHTSRLWQILDHGDSRRHICWRIYTLQRSQVRKYWIPLYSRRKSQAKILCATDQTDRLIPSHLSNLHCQHRVGAGWKRNKRTALRVTVWKKSPQTAERHTAHIMQAKINSTINWDWWQHALDQIAKNLSLDYTQHQTSADRLHRDGFRQRSTRSLPTFARHTASTKDVVYIRIIWTTIDWIAAYLSHTHCQHHASIDVAWVGSFFEELHCFDLVSLHKTKIERQPHSFEPENVLLKSCAQASLDQSRGRTATVKLKGSVAVMYVQWLMQHWCVLKKGLRISTNSKTARSQVEPSATDDAREQ